MKKLRVLLPLLAFLVAVTTSAFTTKSTFKSSSTSALHFYYIVDGQVDAYIGDYDPSNPSDLEALRSDSGCQNEAEVCAKGFAQMNPTDPDSGSFTWLQTQ